MQKERLVSLDVFRGFTIILMTLVNNPGSWNTVYPALLHAEWNGCTFADLVFPFFIFILGVAIPFSMPTKEFNTAILEKIITRSLRIFCLGWFLAFFNKIHFGTVEGLQLLVLRLLCTCIVAYVLLGNFNFKLKKYLVLILFSFMLLLAFSTNTFENIRIPGVLQRIGIVYFCIAVLYLKFNYKIQLIITASILLLYWIIMTLVPVPNFGTPNLEMGTNFAAWLDSVLLRGHMYIETKTWDPEGVLSTLPTIATGLIGVLIGTCLNLNQTKIIIAKNLLLIGIIMLLLGTVWSVYFPLNKALWSSSYAVFTTGLATISLSILYYITEVKGFKKWTTLFLIWGINPMLVFFFSGIIPRTLAMIKIENPVLQDKMINLQNYIYQFYIVPNFDNSYNASLAGAMVYIFIWTVILWLFFRKNIVLKV